MPERGPELLKNINAALLRKEGKVAWPGQESLIRAPGWITWIRTNPNIRLFSLPGQDTFSGWNEKYLHYQVPQFAILFCTKTPACPPEFQAMPGESCSEQSGCSKRAPE